MKVNIISPCFAENLKKSDFSSSAEYAKENSRIKALEIANLKSDDWFLVVGADTVVEKDNVIYEKPLNKLDAFNTLKKLKLSVLNLWIK